jgi:hypothetical protein
MEVFLCQFPLEKILSSACQFLHRIRCFKVSQTTRVFWPLLTASSSLYMHKGLNSWSWICCYTEQPRANIGVMIGSTMPLMGYSVWVMHAFMVIRTQLAQIISMVLVCSCSPLSSFSPLFSAWDAEWLLYAHVSQETVFRWRNSTTWSSAAFNLCGALLGPISRTDDFFSQKCGEWKPQVPPPFFRTYNHMVKWTGGAQTCELIILPLCSGTAIR